MASDDNYDMIFKLVLIGDSFVGKTNIMSKYLKNEFHEDSKATVGVEFGSKKFVVDKVNIKAQIWDTAGQERYKSITNAYYKGSKGAFVVYDITRKETFDSVDKWIADLKQSGDKKITILLIGNKADLDNQRVISKEQGEEKAKSFNVAFLETSAMNGQNLDTAFEMMIKEVYDKFNATSAEQVKEQVDSYVDFNLGKELSEHGLATNFIFKFLAFKPSRTFYSDISKVPEKIQFFFDFFNNKKLNTPVCNVTRPEAVENNNYFLFDNQFILKRENINVNTTLLNDSKTDILIDVRYDPSIDTSIDFRDFIKYLTNKRVLIQIKDVQKCMNVGYIKVPLRDLIGQGKEKIQILKEYDIYDDNFDFRGTVQLLITAEKYKTLKEYNYNRNKFININP